MKKSLRRFGKMALAATLMLSMLLTSVPIMAEPTPATDGRIVTASTSAAPSTNDKGTFQVKNIEKGATVTAYQITEAQYANKAFTGYINMNGVTIADPLKPTDAEISAIMQDNALLAILPQVTLTDKSADGDATGVYEASVAPGYWIVKVSDANDSTTIYSPMLAGVYYSKEGGTDNEMTSDVIDAKTDFNLNGDIVYAKSNQPQIDKKIVDGNDGNGSGASFETKDPTSPDGKKIGDIIHFELEADVPSYGPNYKNLTYNISDQMSDGLDYYLDATHQPTIKVGDKDVTSTFTNKAGETKDTTKSITGMWALTQDTLEANLATKSCKIEFTEDFIKEFGGKKVVVTYYAKLNSDALTNFAGDANTNEATLEYTNNPDNGTGSDKDTTYQYTFELDGYLDGENSRQTNELWKVGPGSTFEKEGEIVKVTKPLPGAEFALKDKDGNVVAVATSDDKGRIHFTGLAGNKDYTLVETKAPTVDGVTYNLDKTERTIRIDATYFDDDNTDMAGQLQSYTVTVDGKNQGKKTTVYTRTEKGSHDITVSEQPTDIINTTWGKLPSTGGAGTVAFVVIGLGLVAFGLRRSRKNMAAR
jgi:fimbrial isopeptide formation D2 family protein/LPXTG-motif cell wall-anchored protein